jgi:NAD(P)-dependent dehydrogenase (short-subunit alcohol dehydrogenase family)/acyl dehydratase
MDESRVLEPADLRTGLTAAFERAVGPQDIQSFAVLSGDHNPLHVSPDYAKTTNYGRQIVHGAFQVALASTLAGMHLPGRNVVVGSFHSRFPAPLFVPSMVRVHGEITNWTPLSNTGTLRVTVVDLRESIVTADILVTFGMHEQRAPHQAPTAIPHSASNSDLPLILVTGAGGAVGVELVQALAGSYRIFALCRSRIPDALGALADVYPLNCDLEAPDWETTVDAALPEGPVYGVVHGAWPSAPKGGLLDTDPAIVARQVEFGSLVTIRLARWLSRRARNQARFIALSTTAASLKPVVNLSAYSLGKATLEHTVRLLAPELARQGITMNAVLPSFMPLGMNDALTKKAVLGETAKVPSGRLCTPLDVTAVVKFLLSPESSFVTGQLFPLTGGQL